MAAARRLVAGAARGGGAGRRALRCAARGDVRAAAAGPVARPRPRSPQLPSLAPSRRRRRLPPACAAGPRVMS